MRDIGKNIRQLRIQKKMTQDELAQALFVTRQTVSNYETGRSRPDVEMVVQMAQVLQTDANTILYGPEEVTQRSRRLRKLVLPLSLTAVLGLGILVAVHWLHQRNAIYYDSVYAGLLIRGWIIPLWLTLAGFSAAVLIHGLTGLQRFHMPAAKWIRWGVWGAFALYALVILPVSLFLVRCAVELMILRPKGDYSFSASFSFLPGWDQLAYLLLGYSGNGGFWKALLDCLRTVLFSLGGVLLWLTGKPEASE